MVSSQVPARQFSSELLTAGLDLDPPSYRSEHKAKVLDCRGGRGAEARNRSYGSDPRGRKLVQYDSGARIPATVGAIADAVRWAERIMEEIDRRHPAKSSQQERRTT